MIAWVKQVSLEASILFCLNLCQKFPGFKKFKEQIKIDLKTEILFPQTASKASSKNGKKKAAIVIYLS